MQSLSNLFNQTLSVDIQVSIVVYLVFTAIGVTLLTIQPKLRLLLSVHYEDLIELTKEAISFIYGLTCELVVYLLSIFIACS